MARKTWTLIDVTQGIHETDFRVTSNALTNAANSWQISQTSLAGGLTAGVDLVEIDNGRMRLFVIPTRGMGIWKAETKCGQTLGWNSPVRGPVHPSFVPIHDPTGLGWLEGFDELVVRCGLESNGAPEFDEQGHLLYPLHGRIANRPAHHVEVTFDDESRTITLRGIVEETRFHFQKLRLEATVTTSLDSTTFSISDRVVNFGGTSAKMQMLYHINVGEPLLGRGATFVAPTRDITPGDQSTLPTMEGWNRFGPPVANAAEECYFMKLLEDNKGQTKVLLKNVDGSAGIALGLKTRELACFSLWKNAVAGADGYVAGLEPATNYPNCRSVEEEAGRIVFLKPGESWSANVIVDWLTDSEEVERMEAQIADYSRSG